MNNPTPLAQSEPLPTIVIACERRPAGPVTGGVQAGLVGAYELIPRVSFTHMPGGWASVFRLLLQALQLVVGEMVRQACEGERRIQVAQRVPGSPLRDD